MNHRSRVWIRLVLLFICFYWIIFGEILIFYSKLHMFSPIALICVLFIMLSYNEVIFCLFEKHFQGDVSHLKKNLMKMVITFWRKNSFPFQVYVHNIIIYVFKYCLSTENNYIGIKLKVCSCNYIQIKSM